MTLTLDLHVHTINSGHAFSTITENAAHAAAIGLTAIGLADHGPQMPGGAHLYHFINLGVVPDMINGVRILKGAEANILIDENPDAENNLDLSNNILEKLDFVIAALHRGVSPPQTKKKHTAAMIKAMENPNVHILGHPGDCWFDIDMEAVVEAAARTGTIVEMNNQSLNPNSTRFNGVEPFEKMLMLCKQLHVPILISSDAHYCTLVGSWEKALELVEKAGIPEVQVMNTSLDRLMNIIEAKRVCK